MPRPTDSQYMYINVRAVVVSWPTQTEDLGNGETLVTDTKVADMGGVAMVDQVQATLDANGQPIDGKNSEMILALAPDEDGDEDLDLGGGEEEVSDMYT